MIQAVPVDERKYLWEGSDPVFHVSLFELAGGSWSEDSWELSGCGVLDAMAWAQEMVAPRGAWALGLVSTVRIPGTEEVQVGFTYLEGYDLNADRSDLSPWERDQFDAMLRRRSPDQGD